MVLIQGPRFDRCSLQNDSLAQADRQRRLSLGNGVYELDRPFSQPGRGRTTADRTARPGHRGDESWRNLAPHHRRYPKPRSVWEQLQAAVPCTAAQTVDWAKAWERHVLLPGGREPVIVVGSAPGGRTLFLWPFEMSRCAGMKLLEWLGQITPITIWACSRLRERRSPPTTSSACSVRWRAIPAPPRQAWRRSRSTGTVARTRLPNCGISSRQAAATP